jgi:hypothetical protein
VDVGGLRDKSLSIVPNACYDTVTDPSQGLGRAEPWPMYIDVSFPRPSPRPRLGILVHWLLIDSVLLTEPLQRLRNPFIYVIYIIYIIYNILYVYRIYRV